MLKKDWENALATATLCCVQKKQNFTDLRQAVFSIIFKNKAPIKAYDIIQKLSTPEHLVKPPTIYRSLDFLMSVGLVHKLNSLNAFVCCSHPERCSSCYFFICNACASTKEICNSNIKEAITELETTYAFKSAQTVLEIQGLCQHCSQIKS